MAGCEAAVCGVLLSAIHRTYQHGEHDSSVPNVSLRTCCASKSADQQCSLAPLGGGSQRNKHP